MAPPTRAAEWVAVRPAPPTCAPTRRAPRTPGHGRPQPAGSPRPPSSATACPHQARSSSPAPRRALPLRALQLDPRPRGGAKHGQLRGKANRKSHLRARPPQQGHRASPPRLLTKVPPWGAICVRLRGWPTRLSDVRPCMPLSAPGKPASNPGGTAVLRQPIFLAGNRVLTGPSLPVPVRARSGTGQPSSESPGRRPAWSPSERRPMKCSR
jgi:hypothetical protein